MTQPRIKGNRARRRCIEYLESKGWKVGIVERTGKFIKEKDLFGLFDLVAVKETMSAMFIQVASNKPHTHKKLSQFKIKFYNQSIRQYVWIDNKGFNVYVYLSDGKWIKNKI